MDPDETLKRVRIGLNVLASLFEAQGGTRSLEVEGLIANAARDLEKHARALDHWLSKGGFFPKAWGSRGVPIDNIGDKTLFDLAMMGSGALVAEVARLRGGLASIAATARKYEDQAGPGEGRTLFRVLAESAERALRE